MATEAKKSERTAKKRQSWGGRWTIERAREEIEAWQQSGLSMAEYCRKRGIQVKQFYNWRSRLTDKEDRKQAKKKELRPRKSREQNPMRLVEAKIVGNDRISQTGPVLKMVLCGPVKIEIEVYKQVDVSWLLGLMSGMSGAK